MRDTNDLPKVAKSRLYSHACAPRLCSHRAKAVLVVLPAILIRFLTARVSQLSTGRTCGARTDTWVSRGPGLTTVRRSVLCVEFSHAPGLTWRGRA